MLVWLIGFLSLSANAAFVGIGAAASQGDVPALAKYLAADPKSISLRNGAGRTPLCVAAMRGQTKAVAFLISQGANVNDKGFQEMTPLADMASVWGLRSDEKCAEVARLLISRGAKIDPVDASGDTPLLVAAEAGKPRLVQLLLENGADVTTRRHTGGAGPTALHLAVENGREEVVKVLLKFYAPLDVADGSGWTPLGWAEYLRRDNIASLLRLADASGDLPPPPALEAMQSLARRIAGGDQSALTELNQVAEILYQGIDYQKERSRVLSNLYRMKAAFDLLGLEAGKGNAVALQALKKSLNMPRLAAFAPDAFGIAAAAGNKEALDILAHYEQWGILDSAAIFALSQPAAKGNQKAQEILDQFRAASAKTRNP
jgi:ankyrin repeat protein